MNSNTTGPILGDDSLAQWHDIAARASRIPSTDSRYGEARTWLTKAHDAIQSWVAQRRESDQAISGNEAIDAGMNRTSSSAAGIQAFGHGASMGLNNVASGLLDAGVAAVNPAVGSPDAAFARGYQQSRDYEQVASADHPLATAVGDAAGTVAGGIVTGAGAVKAFPWLGRTIRAGYGVGASIPARLASAAGEGLIAGGEGVVRGAVNTDGSVGDRAEAAVNTGLAYGAAGVGGGLVSQGIHATHGVLSDARQWMRARRLAAEANLALAPERATVAGERAVQAPLRTATAENRVEAIPLQDQMRADRAQLLAWKVEDTAARRAARAAGQAVDHSPVGNETALRRWATKNMAPDLVDGFVERSRRIPGSGLPRPIAATPATVAPIEPAAVPHESVALPAHAASTPAEAAALPGTMRPDAGPRSPSVGAMARRNILNGIAQPSDVLTIMRGDVTPEAQRLVARHLSRGDAEATLHGIEDAYNAGQVSPAWLRFARRAVLTSGGFAR